jgi:hypothetical protein
MDQRARDAKQMGDKLFSRKKSLVDPLFQELSMNFYVERADFTDKRNDGDEYSDHLFSSYPVLARRELGNMLSSNLRPQSKKWFSIHVANYDLDEQSPERRWLERCSEIQWRAMYDPKSGLVRATKQADHDYVTFGNAVIYGTPNANLDGLLFRNYHLRDCAWSESVDGVVDEVHRNWAPTAKQLKQMFGSKVSRQVNEMCMREPHKEVDCRHVVMPERQYRKAKPNGDTYRFTSLMIETETENVLEEVGLDYFPYVVPRWQTVSGSQYGRSMATAVALPDGRTMQVVVRTLREAGEKFVDPPMVAIADAIRGDIPLYAGGITIADMEYDERLGEVLRPVSQNAGNMPVGFEIAAALRDDVRHAFFLDKITLPNPENTDMTAFEVRRRIEEHIRGASPIFEPIEKEYSAPLCELAFNIMQRHGGFPMNDMPRSLQGADVRFTFRSPLSDMTDEAEAASFVDVVTRILLPVAQIDPAQIENVNMTKALRDAMKKAGWKDEWLKDEEAVEQRRAQLEQMAQLQAMAQVAGEGGGAAKEVFQATKAITDMSKGKAA